LAQTLLGMKRDGKMPEKVSWFIILATLKQ
jgi:hypothetical protein